MQANKNSYKKSSFGPAFFFLGRRRREALANYYEFCRLMDDIADEPHVENPSGELDKWAREIAQVYTGNAQTNLGKRLTADIKEFNIPQDRFSLLIEGMRADLEGRSYPTQEDLAWYLYRVAVIVGSATLDILGVQGPQADQLSLSLGAAVQLTNIIRDVHDDAELGRVYLPEDQLQKFRLTRQDVLENKNPRNLARLLKMQAARAMQFYMQAFSQMKGLPRLKMLPCRVMGYVYLKNLAKINKEGFVFSRPIKLTKGEKIKAIFYALYKTFF